MCRGRIRSPAGTTASGRPRHGRLPRAAAATDRSRRDPSPAIPARRRRCLDSRANDDTRANRPARCRGRRHGRSAPPATSSGSRAARPANAAEASAPRVGWKVGIMHQNRQGTLLGQVLALNLPIDVHVAVADFDRFARQTDDALDERSGRPATAAGRPRSPIAAAGGTRRRRGRSTPDRRPRRATIPGRWPRSRSSDRRPAAAAGRHVRAAGERAAAIAAHHLPVNAEQRPGHRAADDPAGNHQSVDQPRFDQSRPPAEGTRTTGPESAGGNVER